MNKQELLSQVMLDVSRIYELFDEFMEEYRDEEYLNGINDVLMNPERYGLVRMTESSDRGTDF